MEGLQPPTQMTPASNADNRRAAQSDESEVRPRRKRSRRMKEGATLIAASEESTVCDALDGASEAHEKEPGPMAVEADQEEDRQADAVGETIAHAELERSQGAAPTDQADDESFDLESSDPFAPQRLVEAMLFASETPLTAARIASLVEALTPARVKRCIEALNDEYARTGRTFRIEHIARGYQMLSLAEYQPWLARAAQQRGDTRLSSAAMETLAVIAYRQPAMRADVEAVRGVACGDQINRLRELGLVKIVGRAEVVGRPMLYGTTKKFLDVFGLGDLRDLPPMEEFGLTPPRPVEGQSPEGEGSDVTTESMSDDLHAVVSKPREEVEPVAPPVAEDSVRSSDFAA